MNSHPPVCPRCHQPIPPGAAHGVCPACLLAAGFATEPAAPASAKAPPPSIEELAPLFPQLEIIALLGRGGMGAVYKARQKSLDRFVALKLLAPERASDPAFAERFAQEAQALARLDHPHIVTIHDFGQTGDRYYLVMELVDGLNLRHLIDRGRLDPREALAIVPQVCDALQFAHDHGIVHRDIKPENILVDRRGQVKVADFGLAKLMGADETADESRRVMGTPRYMAPEQRQQPEQVDHRADIYALGVVLYQMLTGELPDERQLRAPSHRVRVDVRLDEVVLRALEKDPSRRYASASEFKTALGESPVLSGRAKPGGDDVPMRVTAPAIGLMITAGFNVLSSVSPSMTALGTIYSSTPPDYVFPAPSHTLLHSGMALAASAFAFAGGLHMRRLRNYPWAVAGAVISILAVKAAGMGVVVGIWALIMLCRAEVRAAFRAAPPPPLPRRADAQEPSRRYVDAGEFKTAVTETGLFAPSSETALDRIPHHLSAPALGLMISAGLNTAAVLAITLSGLPLVYLLLASFALAASALTFVGAWRMRRASDYGLAVASGILSILTVQAGGLGIVAGIWALIVLTRPDVRAAFRRESSSGDLALQDRDPPAPEQELVAPSAALTITAALGLLSALGGLVCYFIFRNPLEEPETVLAALVGLPLLAFASIVTLVAARLMRRLGSPGLAVAGALLSIVTAQGAGLGIITGIWALRVLLRRHIQDAFARRAAAHPGAPRRLALALAACALGLAAFAGVGYRISVSFDEPPPLAAPPPPPEHRTPGAFVFGQRLHRTLKLGQDNRSAVLDLDRNQLIHPLKHTTYLPPFFVPFPESPSNPSGVVIDYSQSISPNFSVAGIGKTIVREIGSRHWDNFTDAEAYWSLERGTRPAKATPGTVSGDGFTYLFRTPSGATGLLRILNGGGSPARVRIAWKYFVEVTGEPRSDVVER